MNEKGRRVRARRTNGKLGRLRRAMLVAPLLGLLIIGDADFVGAVHDLEFQLESATVPNPNANKPNEPANILQGQADTDDDAADARDFDWESFFNGSGPTLDGEPNTIARSPLLPDASRPAFIASGAAADFMTPDLTGYATGSKDDLPIKGDPNQVGDGWQCKAPNNLGPKFDALNAAAVAFRRPGDNHLIVNFMSEISSPNGDRNAGFWFLKDTTANCDSGVNNGGNTDWTGLHQNGDVLVVAAFTGGGKTATVSAFKWVDPNPGNNTDADGSLVPQGSQTGVVGNECGDATHLHACAVVNEANEVNTVWASPDADGGNLNPNEFVEGAIDLTETTGESCFATAVANSRSSSTPGSTVHDFARFSFQTCGDLKIVKYVDLDGDGAKETGEPAGRWAFTVFNAGANPATATPVCVGPTAANGELVCPTLPSGSYDIYETQVTGFYNTQRDTATTVDKTAKPKATVSVGTNGGTVTFGNICYVDKTFRINNVPEDTSKPSTITVEYDVNNSGTFTTLALTETATAGRWEASVTDTFLQTDLIDWRWYINTDTANKVTGGDDDSLQAFDPTTPSSNPPTDAGCQDINADNFDLVPLSGRKFKDANGDGQTTGDTGLAGFEVKLFRQTGANTYEATPSATGISVCNDDQQTQAFECTEAAFTFTPASVAPGTYKVVETQVTGWRQTLPAAVNNLPGTRSVTIDLGDPSASVGDWANTPLSNFSMTFTPNGFYPTGNGPKTNTAATAGTITCTNDPGSQTGNTYTASNQPVGTYNCQLVVVDP